MDPLQDSVAAPAIEVVMGRAPGPAGLSRSPATDSEQRAALTPKGGWLGSGFSLYVLDIVGITFDASTGGL